MNFVTSEDVKRAGLVEASGKTADAEIMKALGDAEREHDIAKREFIAAQSREQIAYRRLQDAQRAWFKRFYDRPFDRPATEKESVP